MLNLNLKLIKKCEETIRPAYEIEYKITLASSSSWYARKHSLTHLSHCHLQSGNIHKCDTSIPSRESHPHCLRLMPSSSWFPANFEPPSRWVSPSTQTCNYTRVCQYRRQTIEQEKGLPQFYWLRPDIWGVKSFKGNLWGMWARYQTFEQLSYWNEPLGIEPRNYTLLKALYCSYSHRLLGSIKRLTATNGNRTSTWRLHQPDYILQNKRSQTACIFRLYEVRHWVWIGIKN